jgi:hypothetical protein
MEEPLPGDAPDTPVWTTVQAKEVPATLLDRVIDVAPPEQNVCVVGTAVITGLGFTVTIAVIEAPEQPLAVGVIVYVTVPEVVPIADKV